MSGRNRRRRTIQGGRPFSVLDLPLLLLLDSDVGVYQDVAQTTEATADDDPVGAWQDQSGLGNHVTAAGDDTTRPLLKIVDGRRAVRSDGINDLLGRARLLSDDNFSIYIVCKNVGPDTATGGQTIIGQHNGGTVAGRWILEQNPASGESNHLRMFFNNGATRTVLSTSVAWDQAIKILYAQSDNAGNSHIRIDGGAAEGELTGQTWTPANTSLSIFGLGFGATAGSWIDADAYYILVTSRVLTDAERVHMDAYLRGRYL